MHTLLKSHSEDPISNFELADTSGKTSLAKIGISPRLRQKLLHMHHSSFDWKEGGLKTPFKFLDRDSIEYSLCQASEHDKNEERMALLSLGKGMNLQDPEDGGIFQFSTQNCWQQSQYSKSIAAQAGSLRLYSLAYALLHEHCFLSTARKIKDYLHNVLLTEDGVFQSMSSDSIVPIHSGNTTTNKIFSPILTRENGWSIEALACFYEFTGEVSALTMAKNAADWILTERLACDGGFTALEGQSMSTRLADNLAMARAFLQLYRTTNQSHYLKLADDTAKFICSNFINDKAGFNPVISKPEKKSAPPQIDENICLSRFLNLLHYYTDNIAHLNHAKHGLRYLAIPQIATARMEEAGILLLDEELSSTPLKITIVASQHDRNAAKIRENALRSFGWYKVIHWQEQDYRGG